MRILINDKKHKTNNFISYLLENYCNKSDKYDFKLYVEDKYDKRLVDKRYDELNKNILVQHEDGFNVLSNDVLKDFDRFKKEVLSLNSNKQSVSSIEKENYTKELVTYKLDFFEKKKYLTLEFQYIKL